MVLCNMTYIVEADTVSGALGGLLGDGNDGNILWSGEDRSNYGGPGILFLRGGGSVDKRQRFLADFP